MDMQFRPIYLSPQTINRVSSEQSSKKRHHRWYSQCELANIQVGSQISEEVKIMFSNTVKIIFILLIICESHCLEMNGR